MAVLSAVVAAILVSCGDATGPSNPSSPQLELYSVVGGPASSGKIILYSNCRFYLNAFETFSGLDGGASFYGYWNTSQDTLSLFQYYKGHWEGHFDLLLRNDSISWEMVPGDTIIFAKDRSVKHVNVSLPEFGSIAPESKTCPLP